jgi:hypothetical protein|tara:strand:+ start:898 stop:1350 length:453 start_codon:yes stop_codon:yes gene_type:complete
MELRVIRMYSQDDFTIGALYLENENGREFLCFTLEDEHRDEKVKGETRIPKGKYQITLRTVGGFDKRYEGKFPKMHKGMLWVRDVPGFEYILIHIGNTEENTAGCLLVGDSADMKGMIGRSTNAYKNIYPRISNELLKDNEVWITYEDFA